MDENLGGHPSNMRPQYFLLSLMCTLTFLFVSNAQAQSRCLNEVGKEGTYQLDVSPGTTYVLFTAQFSLPGKAYPAARGVTYILHIESRSYNQTVTLSDLPSYGATLCIRPGLDHRLRDEIELPLRKPAKCGVDCREVRYIQWKIGQDEPEGWVFRRLRGNDGAKEQRL